MNDLVLGQRVSAPDRLVRIVGPAVRDGHYSTADRKSWVRSAERWPSARPQPVTGILVGIRSVPVAGTRTWLGEDGIAWRPDEQRRRMGLVVEDLRRNPVKVWLDDVVPAPQEGQPA